MRKFKTLKKGSTLHMLKQAYWGGYGYSFPTVNEVVTINKDVVEIELDNGCSFKVPADYTKMDFGHVKIFTDGNEAERVFLEECA